MKPILLVCLLLLWTISLRAVDTKKPTDHSHRIVNVQGNPTFLKLEMKLERPRRILQTPKGQLILVDSGAGTVILTSENLALSITSLLCALRKIPA